MESSVLVKDKAGKILYAVAFNVLYKGAWIPGKVEYTHAESAAHAKAAVIKSYKNAIQVIACAPAVGFYVNDKHGEKLSAT